MKTRNVFVSNSSSSSFIIIIDRKDTIPCPHCGRSDHNVLEMIERSFSCESEIDASGKLNVINHIRESYYDKSDADKIIEKLQNISDEDKVYYISIDNNDQYIVDEIRESSNITIINRED